jgi:hypothetical protein
LDTGPDVAGAPRAGRSGGRATVSETSAAADSHAAAVLAGASDDRAMADRARPHAEIRPRAAGPLAPAASDAFLERAAAAPLSQPTAEPASVHVSIGTIEVRATVEPPRRVVPPRGPAKPRVSLDEYLRRRGGAAPR